MHCLEVIVKRNEEAAARERHARVDVLLQADAVYRELLLDVTPLGYACIVHDTVHPAPCAALLHGALKRLAARR